MSLAIRNYSSLSGSGSPASAERDTKTSLSTPPRARSVSLSTPPQPVAAPAPIPFESTISPLLPGLRRLATRILRCRELAEDAVQEALLSYWKRETEPERPAAWLCRAVTYHALRIGRSESRRRKHEHRACSCPKITTWPQSNGPEQREVAEAVRAAIDELPSAYRDVLVLRELEQLEYEVIALRLQIPIGTVRSRLNRSRDEIHRKLKSRLRVLEHPAVVSSFQEPERSPRPERGARA